MLRSASAHLNASLRIKKTNNAPPWTDVRFCLLDDYEQLRSYAIAPVKAPAHPLGLDLWMKRGFLSWGTLMASRGSMPKPDRHPPAQAETRNISNDLVMAFANMLTEWGEQNVGLYERKNQARALDPQGISVHTAIHAPPTL